MSVDHKSFKAARPRRIYKFLRCHCISPPTSPSRCSHRRAPAFKSLFSLRSPGASFAHNYSPLTSRFLSRPIRLLYLASSLSTIQLTHRSASQLLKRYLISLRSSSHSSSVLSFAARSSLAPLHPSPHNVSSTCAAPRHSPSFASQTKIPRQLAASGANRVGRTRNSSRQTQPETNNVTN